LGKFAETWTGRRSYPPNMMFDVCREVLVAR
jgi:hypothetical protein